MEFVVQVRQALEKELGIIYLSLHEFNVMPIKADIILTGESGKYAALGIVERHSTGLIKKFQTEFSMELGDTDRESIDDLVKNIVGYMKDAFYPGK